ncbi:MAG: glycosyltransferase family 87 protein, partial [Planctomycetia bacterium]
MPTLDSRTLRVGPGRWALVVLALAMAAGLFVFRGAGRSLTDSNDFRVPFLASRLWFAGGNPYDHAEIEPLWKNCGGSPNQQPYRRVAPSVYPPTAFLAAVPITGFDWPAARAIWLGLCLVSFGGMVYALVRLAGLCWDDPRAWLLVAFALAAAPVHTAFAKGQPVLPALALPLIALYQLRRGRAEVAGLLVAVAMCWKPQTAGPIAAAVCLVGGPGVGRMLTIAAGGSAVALAVAGGWSTANGVPWFDSWRDNLAYAAGSHGVNDPSATNPSRHHLVNLAYSLTSTGLLGAADAHRVGLFVA